MHLQLLSLLLALGPVSAKTISATPHDSYSSSIGVLGCKINTNRVAYWPSSPSCDDICVRVTHPPSGRHVFLLKIDQSAGAYDMSYDAWNYLYTGSSALDEPTAGGGVEMEYEDVDIGECKDHIYTSDKEIPLSAPNSMNFLAACLDGEPDSYVANNYALFNVLDSVCSLGHDERCDLDWEGGANQAVCPSGIGDMAMLEGAEVYDIRYPTGEEELATSVPDTGVPGDEEGGASRVTMGWAMGVLMIGATLL